MKRKAAKFAIDSVVVNGDLDRGQATQAEASELTLVAPKRGIRCRNFSCRDLRNWIEKNTGRSSFLLRSGHRVSRGRVAEELESVAARVQGVNIKSNFTGRHCKEMLDLDVDGTALNFAHHFGGGSGFTRSGAWMRRRCGVRSPAARVRRYPATSSCESHLHYFMHVEQKTPMPFLPMLAVTDALCPSPSA